MNPIFTSPFRKTCLLTSCVALLSCTAAYGNEATAPISEQQPAVKACCSTTLQFKSAKEISEHFSSERAEALKTYIENNPEADDIESARFGVLDALLTAGKGEETLAQFELIYDDLSKQDPYPLETVMGDIAQGYVIMATRYGKAEEAKAFLARIRLDLSKHEEAAMALPFLGQLEAELQKPQIGDALELVFTPLGSEEEFDLKTYKDKVVLVDFWATWCGPCIGELPHLQKAYKKYNEKGFEIVGISWDDDASALADFIKREKMPWIQHLEANGPNFAERYGVTKIPTTFLLKEGKIIAKDIGGEELINQLDELL